MNHGTDIVFRFGKQSKTKEIRIIGRKANLYLWFGDKDGNCTGHASGNATLLRLAESIIKTIGKPKKKARK